MLPLSSSIEFSVGADLAIAVLLGVGFGFALERAGFGSARRLTAVFYFYDMAVVKVMFTAIVTAMAGIFVLPTPPLLALSPFYVLSTHFAGAGIGCLLDRAGFVIGGYCPG